MKVLRSCYERQKKEKQEKVFHSCSGLLTRGKRCFSSFYYLAAKMVVTTSFSNSHLEISTCINWKTEDRLRLILFRKLPFRSNEVTGIAIGMLLQISLVLFFRIPKIRTGNNFSNHSSRPFTRGIYF